MFQLKQNLIKNREIFLLKIFMKNIMKKKGYRKLENTLIHGIYKSIKKKEDLISNSYIAYAIRSVLACLFLSLGTAIASYTAEKANHIADGTGKFIYSFMFSWSLVMIIYMNAELGTSNMMYMSAAVHRKILKMSTATKILFTCILFNFIGAVLTTFFLAQTDAFSRMEANHYLYEAVTAKLAKSPMTQFIEGIFANIVVNVAVFITIRMKDDAGKVFAMIFIIFIFAFLGFEHLIANFTGFGLVFWTNGVQYISNFDLPTVLSNFLFSGLGNFVGGGLVIGLLYSWLNQNKSELYYD